MDKDIKNADAIVYKLKPTFTKITNYRFKVASEKRRKKEEIVERWKRKAIAAKYQRAERGISLFNEEKKSYKSDIRDEIDSD